jgi:hypothetical protein
VLGLSDGLSISFKIIPKSKVCIYIYTLVFELSLLLTRLGFISVSQSYHAVYIGLLFCLYPCGYDNSKFRRCRLGISLRRIRKVNHSVLDRRLVIFS